MTRALPVTLVTQPACSLCDHAKQVLRRVGQDYPLEITEKALASVEGQQLATEHRMLFAPLVLLDGQMFAYGRLSERKLRRELRQRIQRPGAPFSR